MSGIYRQCNGDMCLIKSKLFQRQQKSYLFHVAQHIVTLSIYRVSLISVALLYCFKPHGDRNLVLI